MPRSIAKPGYSDLCSGSAGRSAYSHRHSGSAAALTSSLQYALCPRPFSTWSSIYYSGVSALSLSSSRAMSGKQKEHWWTIHRYHWPA